MHMHMDDSVLEAAHVAPARRGSNLHQLDVIDYHRAPVPAPARVPVPVPVPALTLTLPLPLAHDPREDILVLVQGHRRRLLIAHQYSSGRDQAIADELSGRGRRGRGQAFANELGRRAWRQLSTLGEPPARAEVERTN